MARLSYNILETSQYFDTLINSSKEKQVEAVKEGAELLKKYTAEAGKAMLNGPYFTGETVAGLTVKDSKKDADGASAMVTYEGMHSFGDRRHGYGPRRLGEVAFVNEYGARGKPAREFNRSALDNNEEAIAARMAEIVLSD